MSSYLPRVHDRISGDVVPDGLLIHSALCYLFIIDTHSTA